MSLCVGEVFHGPLLIVNLATSAVEPFVTRCTADLGFGPALPRPQTRDPDPARIARTRVVHQRVVRGECSG